MKPFKNTIFLLLVTLQIQAQKSSIEGEWLLENIVDIQNNKIEEVAQILNFDPSGTIFIQEMPFGTWIYKKNKVTIDAKKIPGQYDITEVSENELELTLDNEILYFSKINRAELIEMNKNSQLLATWKVVSGGDLQKNELVSFKEPDQLLFVDEGQGMKSKSSGIWFLKKSSNELIIIGQIEYFRGINHIISVSSNELTLRNNKGEFILKKEAQCNSIERLQFSEDDFYDENGMSLNNDEQSNLPWQDYYKMLGFLENVDQLIYQFDVLEENTNTFKTSILTSVINANKEEESLNIDAVFHGHDRFSVGEDQEFPTNMYDSYNLLYPLDDSIYRVIGEENIEVPAGTFQCVVVETIGNFDELIKAYMIKDKPGIIAKIITDKPGTFGHYHVFQLKEIQLKN